MSDLKAKNAQNSIFAGVPPQTPLGELTALPQTAYLYLREPTSKGRRGNGEGEEEVKGKGRGWRKEGRKEGKG